MRCRHARSAQGQPEPSPAQQKTCGAERGRFRAWPPPGRTTRLRGSDRLPASTVAHIGRSCVPCFRSSRRVCPLAPAGNVCWAKPNHAFFQCQQSFAKFFAAPIRHVVATSCNGRDTALPASLQRLHACRARVPCKQALARLAAIPKTPMTHAASMRNADMRRMRARHRATRDAAGAARDFALHKHVCAEFAQDSNVARRASAACAA